MPTPYVDESITTDGFFALITCGPVCDGYLVEPRLVAMLLTRAPLW